MHPSCLVLKSAAGPCHASPVRPSYRQVFWLLDQPTPGAFPGHPSPQWLQPVSSPITAAGPRRFCTVFPLTCKCFYSIPFRPGSQGKSPLRPNTKVLTSTPRAWATGAHLAWRRNQTLGSRQMTHGLEVAHALGHDEPGGVIKLPEAGADPGQAPTPRCGPRCPPPAPGRL